MVGISLTVDTLPEHKNNTVANSIQTSNTNSTTEVYENISSQQQQQVTFNDQRAAAIETGYIDSTEPVLPPQSRHMAEDQYTVKHMLQIPIKYDSFNWTTSQNRNDQIANFSIPNIFDTLSSVHKLQLQTFSFFKFTLRVKFQINSTKFNFGKLMVVWDPLGLMVAPSNTPPLNDHTYHLIQASGYPNAIIDAKDADVVEMFLPWEHVLSCFSASTNPASQDLPLGNLRVLVLNPLHVPSTVLPTVGVTMWISCEDLELNVPTRPHEINYTLEVGTSSIIDNITTGNFSGAIKTAGDDLSKLVEDVGLDKIGKGLGNLLKEFDLDKPALPNTKVTNCLATVDPQAHMKGPDSSIRLGATKQGGYLETDFSSAPPSELMIHEIIQRPMLVGTKQWKTEDVVDTVLMDMAITPQMLSVFDTSANPWVLPNTEPLIEPSIVDVSWYPTYLGFMAQFFEFYSGSIDIRLDFAVSAFHTGRIQISFEPTNSPVPLDLSITSASFSNCPNQIFDLHECATTSFKINYVAQTPRKRRPDFDIRAIDDNDVLGRLRIIVVNPLVVPATLDQEIDFNVYASAGNDFRFTMPCINTRVVLASEEDSLPEITLEVGLDDAATRTSDTPQQYDSLLRGGKTIPRDDVFNEDIDSVLDLARRYVQIGELGVPIATTTFAGAEVEGVGRSAFTIDVTPGTEPAFKDIAGNILDSRTWDMQSFLKALSSMYVFWSGSIRYQIIPFTDRTVPGMLTAYYAPNNFISPSPTASLYNISPGGTSSKIYFNSSYPSAFINTAQDTALQIEAPFYSKFNHLSVGYKALDGELDDPLDPFQSGTVLVEYIAPTATSFKAATKAGSPATMFRVFASAGDDFRLRFLISPPRLAYIASDE